MYAKTAMQDKEVEGGVGAKSKIMIAKNLGHNLCLPGFSDFFYRHNVKLTGAQLFRASG